MWIPSQKISPRHKKPGGSQGFLPELICQAEKLSLDTAGAVAACQLLNLGNGDHVVVAADGVLQSGSSNCELNSCLGVLAGQQSVDQTAAEGVTAADAVDDVQVVQLGEAEIGRASCRERV